MGQGLRKTHLAEVHAENTHFFHHCQLILRGTVPGQKTPRFTSATN